MFEGIFNPETSNLQLETAFDTGWIPSQYFAEVSTVLEPWHWRFVGKDAAEAFRQAYRSQIDGEITFLRKLKRSGALRKNLSLVKRR